MQQDLRSRVRSLSDSIGGIDRLNRFDGRFFCFARHEDESAPRRWKTLDVAIAGLGCRFKHRARSFSSPECMKFSGSVHSRMNVILNYIHLLSRLTGRRGVSEWYRYECRSTQRLQ